VNPKQDVETGDDKLWVLMGKVDEAIAQAEKLRVARDSVRHVASVLSRVGRLEEALELVKRIADEQQRSAAIALIAHEQLNQGNVAEGIALLPRVKGQLRDNLITKIITVEVELRNFHQATEHLALIERPDERLKMESKIELEQIVPPVDTVDYVQRRVERAFQTANVTFAVIDKPLPLDTLLELTRVSATATQLHSRRNQRGCQRELLSALKIARKITDERNRFYEVISIASLAHKLNEPKLAHDIWVEEIANRTIDKYFFALAQRNVRAFDVMNVGRSGNCCRGGSSK
jgi:hypothetical protein